MSARSIEELQVGKAAELAKTFDEWDIDSFAALTGGLHPIAMDLGWTAH